MRWPGETQDMMYERWRGGIRWFAVIPHQMHDGTWVWLERFWSVWVPTHSGNGSWRNALNLADAKSPRPTGFAPTRGAVLPYQLKQRPPPPTPSKATRD